MPRSRPALLGVLLPLAAAAARPADPIRLVLAPAGNEARYRVREQLARIPLPSDAVGTTAALTGALVLSAEGKVSPGSEFTVDLTTLRSDRERRDRYVQTRTLETGQYPRAVLTPTAVRGLPWPLPEAGEFSFELAGDLTLHGVTRPTVWQVRATATGDGFTGQAGTGFTFADFGLTQPRVPIVLSVADTIRLEYSFHLVRAPAGP